LLILTSDKDFTSDFLIVELINRHLPYFRLNAEEMAKAGYTFSVTDTVRREISLGAKTLDLNEVSAVWYRRAIHPSSVAGLSHGERVFVAGELRHLAMGLVLNPDITWANPIDKVSVAEHKLYQLQIARQAGFRVPRTLFLVVRRSCVALRTKMSTERSASQFFMGCSLTKRTPIPYTPAA
ncbi:MAG: MvdC/MvdD family ATP grasp protein, partial [Nitrospirota bacterium]